LRFDGQCRIITTDIGVKFKQKSQEITTDLDIFQLTIILMRVGVRVKEPILARLHGQSDKGENISAAKGGSAACKILQYLNTHKAA
jgi:hypothetical protein